jgi:hypothetical protein
MNPDRQKSTVTLEDLLRLKRAERPPVEFWDQFDRELRAKQLAAIVEPRPWWAPLIRVGARFSQLQLPVGAAAILTLSFLTVREYRTTDLAPVYGSDVAVQAVASVEPAKTETVALNQPEAVTNPIPAVAVMVESEAPAAPLTQTTAADPMPRPASASYAMLGDGFSRDRISTPSARYMAANLAAAQESEPGLGEVLVRPARALAARQTVREPLAQVASPSEARLARLLSPGLPAIANANEGSLHTTDRVARNLTEERLYDSISRVNAMGAGVLVKF